VFLGVAVLVFANFIYKEIRLVKFLNNYTKSLETILAPKNLRDLPRVITLLDKMFYNLPASWAKEILLKNILTELTGHISFSREQKIPFLNSLAQNVSDIPLKDRIYQYIEDEQNNLRRMITDSTTIQRFSKPEPKNIPDNATDSIQVPETSESENIEPISVIDGQILEARLEAERQKTNQDYEAKLEAERHKINTDYKELIESVVNIAFSHTPSDFLEKQLANLASQPSKQELVESLRNIAYKGARIEKKLSAFIDDREEKLLIREILHRIEQMRH
jgi:hypothetical protein